MEDIKKEEYKPKVFDFRAQSMFIPQADGTVKIDEEVLKRNSGYIDLRDTVILDPIF